MPSAHSRLRILCVLASVSVAGPGAVARADPAPPFSVLLEEARSVSPRLAETDAEAERAAGLARQAGARPNPIASVYVENFVGSQSYAALAGQTTLQFDQRLELGGKRTARIAAGAAALEASRAARRRARLSFAVELAARYAEAEASERRIALAKEMLALAREDLRTARLLVETGKEAALRSLQAEAEVAAAAARVDAAGAASGAAFAELSALAATSTPITSTPWGLLEFINPPAAPPAFNLDSSPTLQTATAEREAAARRLRVERLQARPDLTVSAGVRQIARHDVAAVVGLSMPIPVFDQNRGNISAAQAGVRAADARLNTVRNDLEASARSAAARASAAESRLAAAKQGEGAAQEAYRLTRVGYSGGKLPLLEVMSARRALAEARAQTLDARLARLSAILQLFSLAGRTPFQDQP